MAESQFDKDVRMVSLEAKIKGLESELKELRSQYRLTARLLEEAEIRLSDEPAPLKVKKAGFIEGARLLKVLKKNEDEIREGLDRVLNLRAITSLGHFIIDEDAVAQAHIFAGALCKIFNLSVYETDDPTDDWGNLK